MIKVDEERLANATKLYLHKEFEKAESICWEIIDSSLDEPEAFNLLGLIFLQSNLIEAAVDMLEKACKSIPNNSTFLCNLGLAYHRQSRSDIAATCYLRALELQPNFPQAHHNLGDALYESGDLHAAAISYERAIALDPSLSTSKVNLGLVKLRQGDYSSGFRLYESRFEQMDTSAPGDMALVLKACERANIPRWSGECVRGKHILILTEQGLGDSLMAMRYLPLMKKQGVAKLTVLCEPALKRVFEVFPEVDAIFTERTVIPEGYFDFQCPMMSLPLRFGTTIDNIPASPRLWIPEDLRAEWRAKLSAVRGVKVGLVWSGSPQNSSDSRRSIPLSMFKQIFKLRGAAFISLQKGPTALEYRSLKLPLLDWMDSCGDLIDTAALLEQLDLLISVDTSVAHLGGALGKPVWLLNRWQGDWRWMDGRHDSIWYPTLKLFNQSVAGNWSEPLRAVAEMLKNEYLLKSAKRNFFERIGDRFFKS